MREKTILPTNLLDWPRCLDLLPDERLILLWIWACPYLSSCGCGQLPLSASAATLGLSRDAFFGGIKTLSNKKLIIFDEETSEVFVIDWYRFHSFKTTISQQILKKEIDKVKSLWIKDMIQEKSITCLPTPTPTPTSTPTFNNNNNDNDNDNLVCGSSQIKFPRRLSESVRGDVLKALWGMKIEDAKVVMDELAARLESPEILKDPVAWVLKVKGSGVRRTPAGLKKTQERKKIEDGR